MIATDGINRYLSLRQSGKKTVQKLYGLRRGNRSVIDISCKKDPIRCFFINDTQYLI